MVSFGVIWIWLGEKWTAKQEYFQLKSRNSIFSTYLCFFLSNLAIELRFVVGPTRRSIFHKTDASHAKLSGVVNCLTGEIHQSREVGPLEQPQREVHPRRLNKRKGIAKSVVHLFLPQHHTKTDQVTPSPRRLADVSPSLLARVGLRDCANHPEHVRRDSLPAAAGQNMMPLAVVLCGEHVSSLLSLVIHGCSLMLSRYSIVYNAIMPRSSTGRKVAPICFTK